MLSADEGSEEPNLTRSLRRLGLVRPDPGLYSITPISPMFLRIAVALPRGVIPVCQIQPAVEVSEFGTDTATCQAPTIFGDQAGSRVGNPESECTVWVGAIAIMVTSQADRAESGPWARFRHESTALGEESVGLGEC